MRMRTINCYVSNIIPPLIMLFDLFFSKVYFRVQHCIIFAPIFVLYWCLWQATGSIVVDDGAKFPSEFFDREFIVIFAMFAAFMLCSVILSFISWFKFKMGGGDWGLNELNNLTLEEKIWTYYEAKCEST